MHNAMIRIQLSLFCCAVAASSLQAQSSPPSVMITNAEVWTGDPEQPTASTIIISGDKIAAVGGKELAAQARVPKVIDAHGRRIVPGLMDCHAHLVNGGMTLNQLQLRDVASKLEFIDRVSAWSKKLSKNDWVLGRGWTTESWKETVHPSKSWLDAVTGHRPAFLSRMDGHQALVNSRALQMARIDKDTRDPIGGHIERDAMTGEPTGVLKDAAMELVRRFIPEPTTRHRTQALERAKASYNQVGVTTVHDMSNPADGRYLSDGFLSQMSDPRKPRLRIFSYCQTDDWGGRPCFVAPNSKVHRVEQWLQARGFKAYMDGSLGSRTAYMAIPYVDNKENELSNRGLLMSFAIRPPPRDMLGSMSVVAAANLQPAMHAIGDQAIHLVLEVYEQLKAQHPKLRPRVEHVQHLLPNDIQRFAESGIIASMQPLHKADDGRYAERRIGYERCKTSYAFKSLLESDARVCFGSDWPVVSNNPFLGIHSAVTGKTLDDKVFVPEQNITVDQALTCYTTNAAYACGMEKVLGKIKNGYAADVVMLDRDILKIPPEKIKETRVLLTIIGGHIVWDQRGDE